MHSLEFVGRSAELSVIRDVIKHRGVLLLTGAAGIGKTSIIERALQETTVEEVHGLNLIDYDECIARFSEIFGSEPAQTTNAGIDNWLRQALHSYTVKNKPLLWDDFHLADERFVSVLLHVLRTTLLPSAFLLVGRPIRLPEKLLSNRIRHLQLQPLPIEDVHAFSSQFDRNSNELPSSVFGHPYLMKVFFLEGLTRLEDWHRSQFSQHRPQERRALVRHALAHTDLQRQWARASLSQRELDTLHAAGSLTSQNRVPELTVDVLKDHIPKKDWADEEKDLLRFLLDRSNLDARDLVRISELCGRYPEIASLENFLDEIPASKMSDAQLAQFQPKLDGLVAEKKMPAKLALSLYRSQVDPTSINIYLEVHARLIESKSIHDRRLAQLSFLRAAMFSGLNEFPPQAEQYWNEIRTCEITAPEVKEQIAFLLYNMCFAVDDQAHGRLQDSITSTIDQDFVSPEFRRAYALLHDGFRAGRQFRFDHATACLVRSAEIFSYAGKSIHVALVERYLMILYYLANNDVGLRTLLDKWTKNQIPKSDAYPSFFIAMLAWQNGDNSPLNAESYRLDLQPESNKHPLLPGPYVRDYFPYGQAVLARRESGHPPHIELVDMFCQLVSRFRLFIVLGEATVALAQHCLLHGDTQNAKRLADEMDEHWKQTQVHVQALRLFIRAAKEPVTLEELTTAVTPFALFVSRLLTPYFVVLAARVVVQQGLDLKMFLNLIKSSGLRSQLRGRPLEIVDECVQTLEALNQSQDQSLDSSRISTYLFSQSDHSGQARTNKSIPSPAVLNLKNHIDDAWFDNIDFDEFAETQSIGARKLANQFKRCFNKTPKQYQQAKRISEAKIFLRETSWQLTEIAYECGFYDSAQFSRLFRIAAGESPSEYRRRYVSRAKSFSGEQPAH